MSADFEGTSGPDSEFGSYETMRGFAGNDYLASDRVLATIYGGDDDDICQHLYAGEGFGAFLYGEDGNDQLWGGNANDKSYGGKGDDWIWAGLGKNVSWGGSGRDHFGYDGLPDGQLDKVKDFKVKQDFLNFDPATYDRGGASLGDTVESLFKHEFRYGKKAKDDDDYFGYNKKTGIVWYDVDGVGGQAQVDVVKLDKGLAFSHLNVQF